MGKYDNYSAIDALLFNYADDENLEYGCIFNQELNTICVTLDEKEYHIDMEKIDSVIDVVNDIIQDFEDFSQIVKEIQCLLHKNNTTYSITKDRYKRPVITILD